MEYGISKVVPTSYEETIANVAEKLKTEGFGVLTTIDVKETLKKKLNVDFMKYVILGACNPPFAYMSLRTEEQIGLLLPCNVIVYEKGGETHVSIFNPMIIMNILGNDSIRPIAEENTTRLKRVLDQL
jgi:uncharacterized protein (DUF302 family)